MVVVALGKKADDTRYVCDGTSCFDDWTPGMLASAAAALLSAINSLLSALILGKDKAIGLIGSVELAFFYSAIPTVLLPGVAFAFNEPFRSQTGWTDTFSYVAHTSGAVAIVLCCFASTGVAKFGTRMFRFQILSMKGPFFFSLVNVTARLVTAGVAIVALNEGFNWNKGVALGVVMIALCIYSYGSYTNMQAAKALKEHATGNGRGVDESTALLVGGNVSENANAAAPTTRVVATARETVGLRTGSSLGLGGLVVREASKEQLKDRRIVRLAMSTRSNSSLNAGVVRVGQDDGYDEAYILPGDSQQVHRTSEGLKGDFE